MTPRRDVADRCGTAGAARRVGEVPSAAPVCNANRHGDEVAYGNSGCRCPAAREAHRIARGRRTLRLIRSGPERIDGTGTARRLQALAVVGYGIEQLGPMLGIDAGYLGHVRGQRGRVLRSTANAVADLYDRLSLTTGPANKARLHAIRVGWLGPLAWDDDQIDDPNHRPSTTPCPHDGDPIIEAKDSVVVERLAAGISCPTANRAEKYAAYVILRDRGMSPSPACEQVRASSAARRVFAERYEARNEAADERWSA